MFLSLSINKFRMLFRYVYAGKGSHVCVNKTEIQWNNSAN